MRGSPIRFVVSFGVSFDIGGVLPVESVTAWINVQNKTVFKCAVNGNVSVGTSPYLWALQMSKPESTRARVTLSERLEVVRSLEEQNPRTTGRHQIDLQRITAALIAAGYRTLDAQAKALGVHRATAWTIIRTKHKLGRLNLKTTERMLANPQLPPGVRSVVERYLAERPRRSTQRTSSSKRIDGDQPQNAPSGGGVLWGRADEKEKRSKL
jgi:hypothetical protein